VSAEVWVGLLEVTQISGDQLITLDQGAAFTWFTCWASDRQSYETRAVAVMKDYGLHVVDMDEVLPFSACEEISEALASQVEQTRASEDYALYGTFHTYPPRLN
jgi:hypothetical protein